MQNCLLDVGLHTCDALRHLDAQVPGEGYTHHRVADENLVAQANRFDGTVAVNCVADADHWIGEVDEPRLRTGLFHIADNFHDRHEVASSMCEPARTTVLGIRLPDAIPKRDLKILF